MQYYDKARMEINDPSGERDSRFFVTNGLLVVELISGRVQTGDQEFESQARPPSQVPVAGDLNRNLTEPLGSSRYPRAAPAIAENRDHRER